MSIGRWWRLWRNLPQNPVYQREKGGWGSPNPFYSRLSRYSPFVILGALIFGLCAGVSSPTLYSGGSGLAAIWCFLCLPGMLLSALTMYGTLMAPALTAPSISMERDRGTWEILRATPMSARSILLSKAAGALARLRIWPALFALSALQGLMISLGTIFTGGSSFWTGPMLGLAALLRPWLEVVFAAAVGIFFSLQLRSSTTALAASYGTVVGFKLLNSGGVWAALSALLLSDEQFLSMGVYGPVGGYLLTFTGLVLIIFRLADKLDYE